MSEPAPQSQRYGPHNATTARPAAPRAHARAAPTRALGQGKQATVEATADHSHCLRGSRDAFCSSGRGADALTPPSEMRAVTMSSPAGVGPVDLQDQHSTHGDHGTPHSPAALHGWYAARYAGLAGQVGVRAAGYGVASGCGPQSGA